MYELSYDSYVHHKHALMFITILYNIVDSLIQLNSDIIYIYIKKEEKKKKGKIRKRRNKKKKRNL